MPRMHEWFFFLRRWL